MTSKASAPRKADLFEIADNKTLLQSTIPPLENGDHLTVSEFENRYQVMPNLKKAELIEGIVYVGIRIRQHREVMSNE